MMRKCFLHCLKNLHAAIPLPHMEEVAVGRSTATGISDVNCSRNQLILISNCTENTVSIQCNGVNASGIDGFALNKGKPITVEDGTHVEVLFENYFHIIKFDPPVKQKDKSAEKSDIPKYEIDKSKKRKDLNASIDENNSPKRNKVFESFVKKELTQDSVKVNEKMSPTVGTYSAMDDNSQPASKEDSLEKIDDGKMYIFTPKGVISRPKIAAYDLDGTLIKTKSGLVFPKDTYDWQLAFPEVPAKVKGLHNSGYKVVIFTNQAGIGKGKTTIGDFRKKLENIMTRIGVPIQAFISTGKGIYRKPASGMWDTLTQMKNENVTIDMEASFYCGDAAGRKKDHSFADRLYAENLGLPFKTPEPHFSGASEAPYGRPSFEPKLIDRSIKNKELTTDKPEILVMVGFPGSGKSSISSQLEKQSRGRYRSVCRDKLGAWQKCVSQASKYIQNGNSVISDSTNPDKESRSRWLQLAKSSKIPCRCVVLDVSLPHALHNNRFRQLTDTSHAFVADMVFHTYKKKFEEPSLAEGFSEIVKVKFVPRFENDDHETLYFKHLLEK